MKIMVRDLVLELTTRCNMKCAHCLRGDHSVEWGPVDMEIPVIDTLFRKIDSIDNITLTGGEVSLCPNMMTHVLTLAKLHKKQIQGGFIATNGKNVTKKFLNACDEWQWFCLENQFSKKSLNTKMAPEEIEALLRAGGGLDEYGFKVALSLDFYHESIPFKNALLLKSKSWFSDIKMDVGKRQRAWIRRGRAADPGFSGLTFHKDISGPSITLFDGTEPELELDLLYVGTNGDMFSDCDLSYEDTQMVKNSGYDAYLGNILEDSKEELMEKWSDLA